MNLTGAISYRWEAYGIVYKALLVLYPVLMLLFLYAIVSAVRRFLSKNGPYRGEGRQALALLFSLAFIPAVISFGASHILPYSVWEIRFLIVSAPAYMILLATTVLALVPSRLRTVTISLLVGWALLSGFTELNYRNKFAVQPLVRQMIEREVDRDGKIKLYVNDANAANAIRFYLGQYGETRFETGGINELDRVNEGRFWVAFLKYRFEDERLPQDTVRERGFEVGEVLVAQSPGYKLFLFPARRP
jgi:hypothetical protein